MDSFGTVALDRPDERALNIIALTLVSEPEHPQINQN